MSSPGLTGGSILKYLYTYKAFVERVIDGDTIKVELDLGFNTRIRQTLRLKNLDCPEMDTREGKAAKRFVEDLLTGVPFIAIKTVKSDKYDRYLADVFIPGKQFLKDWNAGRVVMSQAKDLLYLNNELIQKGQAVKVRW